MREPENYSEMNKENHRTYGARFIQRNNALDALIETTGFNGTRYLKYSDWIDNLVGQIKSQEKFKKEIDSQIHAYGKGETLKVVNFLIDAINNETTPESLSGTNFTEEQKKFLLTIRGAEKDHPCNILLARENLENAYRKCDWSCI